MTWKLTPVTDGARERERAMAAEGGFSDGATDAAEAVRLLEALTRARVNASWLLDEAEEAVFRWYSPWARSVATASADTAVDPVAVERAAELGLAKAVLRWRHQDGQDFEQFARTMITEQLRRGVGDPDTHQLTSVPAAFSRLPGPDEDVASPAGTNGVGSMADMT
jgi:hypothetical protein